MSKLYPYIPVLFLFLTAAIQAQTKDDHAVMVLEGHYTGNNIFIKNTFLTKKGYGFCVKEVKVNGDISTAEVNAELIEIPLDEHKLKTGDHVKMEIVHEKTCDYKTLPGIMNPGALLSPENYGNFKENHLILNGKFYFSNLFVTNPSVAEGNGSCIKKVLVNGKEIEVQTDRPVFKIDLMKIALKDVKIDNETALKTNLKEGESIKIEIIYAKGCDPMILNPEAIVPFVE